MRGGHINVYERSKGVSKKGGGKMSEKNIKGISAISLYPSYLAYCTECRKVTNFREGDCILCLRKEETKNGI